MISNDGEHMFSEILLGASRKVDNGKSVRSTKELSWLAQVIMGLLSTAAEAANESHGSGRVGAATTKVGNPLSH